MSWYLAKTKYGNEHIACRNLDTQGFGTYCPEIDIEKRVGGKRRTVTEPAFRGYVFVDFDPAVQSAGAINNTTGVYGLVLFGSELTEIPSHTIDNIRKTFESKQVTTMPQAGDLVRITGGPFKDLEAIFKEPDGDARSVILLSLLNQKQLIIIDNNSIKQA